MNNPIDGPGGPNGPDWTRALDDTQAAQDVGGVDPGVTGIEGVGAAVESSPVALEGLEAAIDEVARALGQGAIADPLTAVENVISKAIELQNHNLPEPTLKRMTEELQAVLMEDPFFVLEVEGLLADALDRV